MSICRAHQDVIRTNVLWIRNCSAYNESMTSHALGGQLVDAACTLTSCQHFSAWNDATAAILKVWRHIRNPNPSIDAYFPIRFETTEPYVFWKASPQQAQEEQEEEQQQDEYRYVISFWSRKVVNTVQRTVQTEKKQQRQSVFNAGQASGSWFEYHLRLKRETVVVIRVECFDE